ncbi:MAG: type I restriction endonuclease subunit S [Deltaproteobacteria bacterium]|nr:MAG: type I restriction endonuclease subunit S [Deltaproteobacteria bacterium]
MIAGELEKFQLGWCSTKGEDLFDFVRGVTFNKSESTDQPSPGFIGVLRAGNLQDGIIIYEDLVYVPANNVKDIQLINKFDLIIAMSSGSKKVVGKVSFVQKDNPEIAFGAFCGLLRPKNRYIGVWLKHFFQTNAYRYHISETAAGVNINNLKKEHFFALNFPLPPVN